MKEIDIESIEQQVKECIKQSMTENWGFDEFLNDYPFDELNVSALVENLTKLVQNLTKK